MTGNWRREQYVQVLAAANPASMVDEIAETMRQEKWDKFWHIMIIAVTLKRRMVCGSKIVNKLMLR